ncbi:MAG: hypothetical protein GF364_04060 [Candidatus Lokiarchaeota archaeon]|nr:hypothetical protein [Candidatus Lokiarchaeota archaeon]
MIEIIKQQKRKSSIINYPKTYKIKSFMKKQICPQCGKEYKRSSCEYCAREKKWDDSIVTKFFTPRVNYDLKKFDMELKDTHIKSLRNNKSLLLTSEAGTGKTLYACQLLLEVVKLDYIEGKFKPNSFAFLSLPELFYQLKQMINKDDCYDLIDKYQNIHYLIIDDLGVENASQKTSDWYLTNLYLIINYRYEYIKPTIYTTNLSPEEISESIDDRIATRISNNCKIANFKR